MQDFNTMQNLFSTITPPQTSTLEPKPSQDLAKINLSDFNTIQNLFATGFNLPIVSPLTPKQ